MTKVIESFRRVFNTDVCPADNKYDCFLKCSLYKDSTYVVYFKTICQCIVNLTVSLDTSSNYCVENRTLCNDLYCQGDTGLLFFAISRTYIAQMDKKLNLSVYSVPTLHCLLITKNVYDIKPIKDCEQKLKKIECDVMVISIIFRIGNIYIQRTCNHSQSYNSKMYFRVISLKYNKDATNAFPNTQTITHTTTKNKLDSVSQADQTTIFNQNDSIIYATAINTYGRTT
ncbi:uncharacterized protein LOC127707785 [Mytilus californianus]|uniref:uncharacterized protein LOC127707785 n=1 Tax=Mytilus californianus TaxID=6549 RepID=UPI002247B2D7|nr:uncharacterized protein LOC127707785 [Mytilus californianus]